MERHVDSGEPDDACKTGLRRVRVFVSGRVQGVFFRAETHRQALKLALTGWVKNRDDGKVEAVFEGSETAVTAMLEWCGKGPSLSRVTGVDIVEETPAGDFERFEIKY